MEKIAKHLCEVLMGPAIPLFVRLCDNVQKTGESLFWKFYVFFLNFEINESFSNLRQNL